MHRALVLLALLGHLAGASPATSTPSARTPRAEPADPVPLPDYLALLERIAPAARAGAEDYLAAFERRCGRPLTAAELRRAVADGAGDPVLIDLIRANQAGDAAARTRLSRALRCPGGPR